MDVVYNEASASTATPAPSAASGGNKDKVGDILRKERLTRRIAVETIARDLKLNVAYIKALEASEYESLPADPYVRVYIKSLTKYLSLDSDAIMKEFYRERGLIADEADPAATKIDVSVQIHEKNHTPIVIAALVVVLAVFAFIANQKGWITQQYTPPDDAVEENHSSVNLDGIAHYDAEDSLLANMHLNTRGGTDTATAMVEIPARPTGQITGRTPPRP